ncbi:D-glycero-D-manno-heptose 1-phosphate guanosyltransferase, partial [Campylobacter jejuni]|nr:D-glycero-D-manno-heptose 1-phosphate guanosyltransferase [Campylobacter jejuni]EDP6327205.1 D-glycero-D-manno-heptose 1-phosphate guanosyltransferase [Campylobacter jejuni]
DIFDKFDLEKKFSFEEFLQENYIKLKARAEIFDDYFIDIGVPEGYYNFTTNQSHF